MKEMNSLKRPFAPLRASGAALVAAAALLLPASTGAHGFAGQRFFPATIATDDPFVADELSLPTFSTVKVPGEEGGPAVREYDVGIDLAKRITPRFGLGVAEDYTWLEPDAGPSISGFQNVEVGMKYQFWESDAHEALASGGVDAEIGGTGRETVGAEKASTITPGLFLGKGLGDLPDGARYLRPLALTGQFGVSLPTSADADSLVYGFAIEYSLIYLQAHVKDLGLPAPLNRVIPLVEFALETPFNRETAGQTTGTINPGVIWSGQHCQLGCEAIIPANARTGSEVGVVVQLHFYLDDLFPRSLGRPLFRN
jgi:hypothetical protein